ncbi:unnamed protein product [Urochloa humidicola]
MREARGMRLGGHEDVARRSSAVERGGPKRWLSAAMQAAAEAPERMVGMALGTAGCAPGAEECSAPILSRYSTVSLHSGSEPRQICRSWCRAGSPPPPRSSTPTVERAPLPRPGSCRPNALALLDADLRQHDSRGLLSIFRSSGTTVPASARLHRIAEDHIYGVGVGRSTGRVAPGSVVTDARCKKEAE